MRTKSSTQSQFSSHLQSLIHRTLCFQFSYFLLIILVSVVFILRKIYKRMKKRSIMFLGIMRSKIDGRVKRWLMNGTVQMLMCLTMSLCVGIHLQMKAKSSKTMEDWLLNTCEECAKILQDQFPLTVSHVHSLALLMSTFHHNKTYSSIDQNAFADYTRRTAFQRPLLSWVAYAQRLFHADRVEFENQHGLIIKTMQNEPSSEQDEYAPVIFSQERISQIIALDMMSGKEGRENILRARATGKIALTNPFRLFESNQLGVILTFPAYNQNLLLNATVEERVKETVGYLFGAFELDTFVENLFEQVAGNRDVMVNVYDVTNMSKPLIMYGTEATDGYKSFTHATTLEFADPYRKHQIQCRYNPPIQWFTFTIPSLIFAICMLVGWIFCVSYTTFSLIVVQIWQKAKELRVRDDVVDIVKSQFPVAISHEIRTPLNGIIGILEILLDTNLNSIQKDLVHTAQMSGHTLLSLINEVLDRAKLDSGKLQLEATPFNLRSVLDEIISLFSLMSREKDIELAVVVSDSVPEILVGDSGRFRQIVTNLVGNAIKFTEQGHILVHVHLANLVKMVTKRKNAENLKTHTFDSASSYDTLSGVEAVDKSSSWEILQPLLSELVHISDDDDVTLVVTVEDTGAGIPQHAKNQIFTPFMQADSSIARNYGGTGIGLSISKSLVELMGGQMSFVSRSDIGSTFAFTIVFTNCDQCTNIDIKRKTFSFPIKGINAVVVDDRPLRGAITKYHLQRLGITVQNISNLMDALVLVTGQNSHLWQSTQKNINIVLIEKDLWKTDVDSGFHKKLLDWKKKYKIPVMPKLILLATSDSGEVNNKDIFDALVVKPLRASLLAACLEPLFVLEEEKKKETQNISNSCHTILRGKNILVVDDNLINCRVAQGQLKKYGGNVEYVASGENAISRLQIPHNFDMCFMDVQMPGMDGLETTRRIRMMETMANENTPKGNKNQWHLPIFAMTADVFPATIQQCTESGMMDGYVFKPLQEKQVYDVVARFVT